MAVKFERHGTRCPQLRHEYKVYRELANSHGFCSVYHFGTQDNYNVMVMDLLGPSLEDLFTKCQRRFSLKTVLQLADQMLERVDTLHSRHLIHRDIKPANFVIGLGENGANVYCVDFGLSKRYRHPKNLQHIPHRDGRSLTGTPRYASINNHLGIEQSRRDDLESIGYVLVYFLKGSLPWQGLKAKNAQKKYRLILEKKQQVSIAQLCQGCPSQFAEFLAYTRSLKFDARPDIPYLRKLFRDLYHAQGCGSIGKLWDWDAIDTDYFNNVGSENGSAAMGPPAMLSSQVPRPGTAAAVAAGGVDGDILAGGMDGDEYDVRKLPDRPSTAGAANVSSSRQGQNSWAYSRQGQEAPNIANSNAYGQGGAKGAAAPKGMDYELDPQRLRPHTAGATGRAPGAVEEEDAHVVAGARAMMRYRRTRSSAQEEAEELQIGRTWTDQTGIKQQQAQGQMYGKAAAVALQQLAPGQVQGAVMPYGSYQAQVAGGQRTAASKQQLGATAPITGWIGDRPKSASLTAGQTGGMTAAQAGSRQQQVAAGQQPPAVAINAQNNAAANNNTLSYGSLKNRFLSGSKGSKSSKLFTLSR